jgi:Spy/CpxP family protein refolding chaperone
MTSNRRKLLALTAFALLPAGLAAQDTVVISRDSVKRLVGRVIPPQEDPAHAFEQYLFPPELVMQHQARLKITEAQRNVIVAEISKLQATAVQVQWRVGDESEKLTELLQGETVAEADVLAQADRMIMYETAVKRAQLSMLIRIRNVLTPEQRGMLRELRRRRE